MSRLYPVVAAWLAVLFGLSLMDPGTLPAQASPPQVPVKAGDRIRVTQTCDRAPCARLDGRVIETPADSIVIRTGDVPRLAIPRAAITRMEVGHNRHGVRKGAIAGGVALGLFGAFAGGAARGLCEYDCSGSTAGAVLGGAVIGGAIGAGLGALFGALIAPMQWIPVSAETFRMTVIRLPQGQSGIGVRLGAPW